MWYFTWILGLGLALAFGIVNVMWPESSYFSGELDEERVGNRFQRGGRRIDRICAAGTQKLFVLVCWNHRRNPNCGHQ